MTNPRPVQRLPFDLQQGERLLTVCRRHWVFAYPLLALHVLIALTVPVLAVALRSWIDDAPGPGPAIATAVAVFWLLFWAVRAYLQWYRYRHDLWVVTDQRVVDSLKRHWFHHRMASAELIDIEDMFVERSGVLATLLDFGDVRCQTAGEVPNFVLSGIPRPRTVMATIDAARDESRRSLSGGGRL